MRAAPEALASPAAFAALVSVRRVERFGAGAPSGKGDRQARGPSAQRRRRARGATAVETPGVGTGSADKGDQARPGRAYFLTTEITCVPTDTESISPSMLKVPTEFFVASTDQAAQFAVTGSM